MYYKILSFFSTALILTSCWNQTKVNVSTEKINNNKVIDNTWGNQLSSQQKPDTKEIDNKNLESDLSNNKALSWSETVFNWKNLNDSWTFSEAEVKNILLKIDDEAKKQLDIEKNATWSLVQWWLKAKYISNNFNVNKSDKIAIDINWTSKEITWVFDPISNDLKSQIQEFKLSNSKGNKEKDASSSWIGAWLPIFSNFKHFSPSWYYLTYLIWAWEYYWWIIVDTSNWKTVLKIDYPSLMLWTPDKKQYIYSAWSEISECHKECWLFISAPWKFPIFKRVLDENNYIDWWYVDEKYLYIKWYIYAPDAAWNSQQSNYLKIFDYKNLKEIYSKEITSKN